MSKEVFSDQDIIDYINSTNLKWEVVSGFLEKKLEFKNFDEAFSFMESVAKICKQHNHHPYWINDYKLLTIKLRTNDQGGITQKDLNLAKEIDNLK